MNKREIFDTFSKASKRARKVAREVNQFVSIEKSYCSKEKRWCNSCGPYRWDGPEPGEQPIWIVAWEFDDEQFDSGDGQVVNNPDQKADWLPYDQWLRKKWSEESERRKNLDDANRKSRAERDMKARLARQARILYKKQREPYLQERKQYYESLTMAQLDECWTKSQGIPEDEKALLKGVVRKAKKIDIPHTAIEVCPSCLMTKVNCACRRS